MELIILNSSSLKIKSLIIKSIKFNDISLGEVELLNFTKNYIYYPINNSEILITKSNDEIEVLQLHSTFIDVKDNKVIISS